MVGCGAPGTQIASAVGVCRAWVRIGDTIFKQSPGWSKPRYLNGRRGVQETVAGRSSCRAARHQRSLTSPAMAASLPAGRNAMQKAIVMLAAAAALAVLSNAAQAQSTPNAGYPDRPITLVVPYAAGGPVGTIAR